MTEPPSQTLSLKDLLDIVEKIEGRINSYWNFYTIALFAIASWIFGSSITFNAWKSVIISMAIALFFASNFMFVTINENRLAAIESEIRSVAGISRIESERFRKFLASNLMPHRQKTSAVLHLFVDFVVILFVLGKGFH